MKDVSLAIHKSAWYSFLRNTFRTLIIKQHKIVKLAVPFNIRLHVGNTCIMCANLQLGNLDVHAFYYHIPYLDSATLIYCAIDLIADLIFET